MANTSLPTFRPIVSNIILNAIPYCIVLGPFISFRLIENNKYSTLNKVYIIFSASIIAILKNSQYRINSHLFTFGVLSVAVLTPIVSKIIQNYSADENLKQSASFIEKGATLVAIIINSVASVRVVNDWLGAPASLVVGLSLCALTIKVLTPHKGPQ